MTNLQQYTLTSAVGPYDKRQAVGAQRKTDVLEQPLLPDTESQSIDNERQYVDRVLVQPVVMFWIGHLLGLPPLSINQPLHCRRHSIYHNDNAQQHDA